MKLRRAALAVLSASLMGTWAVSSVAQAPAQPSAGNPPAPSVPVVIEWRAPTCERVSSDEELRNEVSRLLGGTLAAPKSVRARADVSRSASGFRVVVSTEADGRPGERTIEAASCTDAHQAAALVIALTIDPTRVAAVSAATPASPSPPASPTPTNPPPTAAAPTPPPPVETKPPPLEEPAAVKPTPAAAPVPVQANRSALAVFLTPGALIDVGTLPSPSIGPALSAAVEWRRLRGELEAHFLPANHTVDATGPAGVFGAAGGEGRACARILREPVGVAACATASVDQIFGAGRNVDRQIEASGTLVSAGVGATATIPLFWRVRGRLSIDGLAPFERTTFFVQTRGGEASVHEVGPALMRASLGLEFRSW